jgi:hypothetical protein
MITIWHILRWPLFAWIAYVTVYWSVQSMIQHIRESMWVRERVMRFFFPSLMGRDQ